MAKYKIGDRVYVKDGVEYDVWEGEVLDVSEEKQAAYVGYETDYYYITRWIGFRGLEKIMTEKESCDARY